MKIIATPILASKLKQGDLFSVHGPGYWEGERFNKTLGTHGELVFIRNEQSVSPEEDGVIYHITIDAEDDAERQ